MSEQYKTLEQCERALAEYKAAQKTCPSCGHCPHCGRGGWQAVPYYPAYPVYPSRPWWHSPVTYTATNTADPAGPYTF